MPDRRRQGRLRGGAGSSVGGSQTFAEDLSSPVSEERTHASYALIPRIGFKRPWPSASVDFTKREAGVVRVTCIITRLSPWSRTGAIRSAWRSRADFVKSATLRWALYSDGSFARPQSAARIARSKDAGDGQTSHRSPTAAGAFWWRFPLTERSRRDSILGTGRHRPDEQPAQVLDTPARA